MALLLIVAGILGGSVAYGLYYRSDYYRRKVERALTDFFGLPTDVATVRPDTLQSRALGDVEMWLPERRARIFWSPRAVWDASANDSGGTVLHLYDSILSIGSEAWESDDYMRVLRASLLHNFSDLNIRRVEFHNASITWPRREFQIRAEGVDGRVDFDDQGHGQAVLVTHSLNGIRVDDPIRIRARIDPSNEEDFLPEVALEVPPLPLPSLGLSEALGAEVTQGSFAGRIVLEQTPDGDVVELHGLAEQIRLEEITGRLRGGPLSGLVDLTIHRAVIRGEELEHLRFNAEARDLQVDALLTRFGLPAIGGVVNLQVLNGLIVGQHVQTLSLAGHWRGGRLAGLSELILGTPSIDGDLDVRISSMVIRDDQLASGHLDISAYPPSGKAGTIERALLLDLLERYVGIRVPPMLAGMLPESVEFVRAEAKLLIDGQTLQVLTIPRVDGGGAIFTVRVGGREVPLVRSIDRVFDLSPLLDRARDEAKEWKKTWTERRGSRQGR